MADERRDATVTPGTVRAVAHLPPATITITHHAWYTWAEIAIRHECLAKRAREAGDVHEYRPGLVAITSAAFALDALAGVAAELGFEQRSGRRGGTIAERLKRGVDPGKLSAEWPRRILNLLEERNAAVHFEEQPAEPVWHPSLETKVDPFVARWGSDGATAAVDLLLEVLAGWADHPSSEVQSWATAMADSVRALELLRASCR
jgi:hypothetical protein